MKTVYFLMLFSVLIHDAHGIAGWAEAVTAVSTASGAVISGTSMISSLAAACGTDYSVVCTIEVENWTKYALVYPESALTNGEIKHPPVVVLPGKREAFITHKTGHIAFGTFGTASWVIAKANRRAVVMWSCPFNFNHFSNKLAVGLTKSGSTNHNPNWADQMYYEKHIPELNYQLGDFNGGTKYLVIRDDKFIISGTIGTSHKTKAQIYVRPLEFDDLAEPLKTAVLHRR